MFEVLYAAHFFQVATGYREVEMWSRLSVSVKYLDKVLSLALGNPAWINDSCTFATENIFCGQGTFGMIQFRDQRHSPSPGEPNWTEPRLEQQPCSGVHLRPGPSLWVTVFLFLGMWETNAWSGWKRNINSFGALQRKKRSIMR